MNRRDFIGSVACASVAAAAATVGPRAAAADSGSGVPTDWLLVDGSENSVLNRTLLDELRAVGVTCCNYNPLSRDENGLGLAAEMLNFLGQNKQTTVLAKTVADIRAAKRSGKVAFLVGWQSSDAVAGVAGYFGPWETNPTRPYLRAYYELGLRI